MNPNISEFSYGYTVTEETIQAGPPLKVAPLFPSLIGEGKVGYDVFLDRPGLPLFLQFKLSHCMVRNNAIEIRFGYFPAGTRFYRMYLRPRGKSRQHKLLLALEIRGNVVKYVAPLFHEPYELNDAYATNEVTRRSIFVSPSWVGPLPDDRSHHIAFDTSGARYFLSEPEPPEYARTMEEDISFSALVDEMVLRVRDQGDRPLRAQAGSLVDHLIEILSQQPPPYGLGLDRVKEQRQQIEPLRLAGYLSRTYFDCELLLIGLAEHHP